MCCAATAGTRATCSTSGTGSPPTSIRGCWPRSSTWCTSTAAATAPSPGRLRTPRSPEDVEAYYTHIRRGRPPAPEQLADLTRRYDAIGGISPLAQRTEAQRAALAGALDQAEPGRWTVVLGQKHAAPFIEDGVAALVEAGVEQIVGLVLAPHFSRGSVGEYHARAGEVAATNGLHYTAIDSWHLEPAYLDFLANAVSQARGGLSDEHTVLFTAHSLPERILEGDAYPEQLQASAAAVAERLGLPSWSLAWQSAGRTPEPWRGPDILEVIRELAAAGPGRGVLVCAQGFTSDHLEVLFDLDIEAAHLAAELGIAFARTRSLNDDASVMTALAERVVAVAQPIGSAGTSGL
jgi:ferrochelatase